MEIEINGIKYRQKEKAKRKPISKTMAALLVMSEVFNSLDPYAKQPKREPSVNIIKEFELIQNKQSRNKEIN